MLSCCRFDGKTLSEILEVAQDQKRLHHPGATYVIGPGPPDRSYGFFKTGFSRNGKKPRFVMADISGKKPASFQKPANDNQSRSSGMLAIVTIPKDLPTLQVEIEVFALLLDDWKGFAANDNEEPPR